MRRAPVVPLPSQDTPAGSRLVDSLHRALGFVTSFIAVCLVKSEAGTSLSASSPGTVAASSEHVIDWNDTGADEFRLVGSTGGLGGGSVEYRVDGVMLATASIAASGVFAGAWRRITLAERQAIAKDQTAGLYVVGSGSVTAYSIELQARTVSRVV